MLATAVFLFILIPTEFSIRVLAWVLILFFIPGLSGTIAHLITKKAELAGTQPNPLFDIDITREKRRYGPLRANRIFGHPVGGGKK